MKEGDKILGFKFNNITSLSYCVKGMDKFIGKVGVISCINKGIVEVDFGPYEVWAYPEELAAKYIVNETINFKLLV